MDNNLVLLQQNRERVSQIRAEIQRLFHQGANGHQLGTALSEAIDLFLKERFEELLETVSPELQHAFRSHACIIGVGGTGREDPAPYSDVDLLLLSTPAVQSEFESLSSQLVQICWDSNLKLGQSMRTPREAMLFAKKEVVFTTATLSSRLLWGSQNLYQRFQYQFHRNIIKRRSLSMLQSAIEKRLEEREQFGSAVCQLEPDVKKAPGGLRDLHLILWIGAIAHQAADFSSLRLQQVLPPEDIRRLLEAQEFLMKLRFNLHFHSSSPNDVLTRDEQLRICNEIEWPSRPGQRPVEQFMRTYFEHSSYIYETAEIFRDRFQPRSLKKKVREFITTHKADDMFHVGTHVIKVRPKFRERVVNSIPLLLKLFYSAMLNNVEIESEMIDLIRRTIPSDLSSPSAKDYEAFLSILNRPNGLSRTLRAMSKSRLLSKFIPESEHIRCLMQFNQYHSYTVDEHTFRALQAAENLLHDDSPAGSAYRSMKKRRLLHLAIYLHDIGKGYGENHSEVGRRIAEIVTQRFRLTAAQVELVTFLVHKHLMMAHLAFRRDYTDPALLLEFTREIGRTETLKMLYVLTVCDIQAVGPKAWTDWKAELLNDLYDRALLLLSGKHSLFHETERMKEIQEQVIATLLDSSFFDHQQVTERRKWIETELSEFSTHYVTMTPPDQIAEALRIIHDLKPGDLHATGVYDSDTDIILIKVIAHEESYPRCFHKITGTLAAKHLEILNAEIDTTLDQILIDQFRVRDNDYKGESPPERIEEIIGTIKQVLRNEIQVSELFQRHRRYTPSKNAEPVSNMKTRIAFDNETSEECTVIDVFAYDRPGLLFDVSRRLYELDISVKLAKISTHLDQIVDVFYVVDRNGNKIEETEQLHLIRDALMDQIARSPLHA